MSWDVVVIGAGPAGLAAALQAGEFGLSVLVLDEQPAPGGQRFRAIEAFEQRCLVNQAHLSNEDNHGATLTRAFRRSDITCLSQASVWDVSPGGRQISYLHQGRSYSIRPKAIIVATGAIERPTPIPGWTLPGVMTAGAAQILLRTSGRIPEGRIVLLGCGPLLLLAAQQLRDAGANVVALLQTTSLADFARASLHLPSAMWAPKLLLDGLKLFARTASNRTVSSVRGVKILGENQVRSVEYVAGSQSETFDCDVVLLHFGLIPNIQIPRLAGAELKWDDELKFWQPVTDDWQESSIENLMIAGDSGGILGAEAAEISGKLAVLKIARRLDAISESTLEKIGRNLQRERHRYAMARAFMDAIYRPPLDRFLPIADTVVCRCEEVTAKMIEAGVANGADGTRRLKARVRAGMGPCRGQMCSMATAAILSKKLGIGAGDIELATVRPPIRPLTIGQLAENALED
ncbi:MULTISPECIES: NAD(P)/FAD-dependent oxidoreductase [unclassified Sinorhizobium]|uniref:NAD(P)/FAD-dependent oxidoreductase n=1 Tax=unclassified Sinorhizobium TaxID=2613772 RepID=UPI0024C38369|nr:MULTISPECIES: NAD(P)/FAD-dependent oxidoreductase [unclassified Sinorhizobium]MDK1378160.1 NAD(P)/FAD-dependent oxidoreductase [Sinorhizobium sp. 6-70]MDK1479791.1 NAD(P)/FAD-dependent oxidoreductase [Sinorhizobium sp. 6-117]